MSDENNIEVLNTPRWSCRQVLLESLKYEDTAESVCVVMRSNDGRWHTTIGGSISNSELFMAAAVLHRRAEREVENW